MTETSETAPQSAAPFLHQRWLASEYLDNGEWGVLSEENWIVVGVSSRLTKALAEHIAEVHNRWLTIEGWRRG